jgi:hypothetical protein
MKPAVLLLILLSATPLLAINTNVLRHGDRIGVLRMSDEFTYGAEQTVAKAVQGDLQRELRARGFDAFDTGVTYDELRRVAPGTTPYYVEVVSANAADREHGGIGAGTDGLWATVSVVVSRVAAEVRVYDGKTLELVDRFELAKKSTAVVPTSVGIGGRNLFAAIALPFVHYGQYRSAAHEVARQAAERIAQSALP